MLLARVDSNLRNFNLQAEGAEIVIYQILSNKKNPENLVKYVRTVSISDALFITILNDFPKEHLRI